MPNFLNQFVRLMCWQVTRIICILGVLHRRGYMIIYDELFVKRPIHQDKVSDGVQLMLAVLKPSNEKYLEGLVKHAVLRMPANTQTRDLLRLIKKTVEHNKAISIDEDKLIELAQKDKDLIVSKDKESINIREGVDEASISYVIPMIMWVVFNDLWVEFNSP